MKFVLVAISALVSSSSFAGGSCGNEAGGYAQEWFQTHEGHGLAEPFLVAPQLVGSNNRGDRAEVWKVTVAKFENGQRVASTAYQVKVDALTCALLSIAAY